MPQVLQQLQLSISPLAQDGSREGLHDLLDGNGGTAELILGGTNETEGTCGTRTKLVRDPMLRWCKGSFDRRDFFHEAGRRRRGWWKCERVKYLIMRRASSSLSRRRSPRHAFPSQASSPSLRRGPLFCDPCGARCSAQRPLFYSQRLDSRSEIDQSTYPSQRVEGPHIEW